MQLPADNEDAARENDGATLRDGGDPILRKRIFQFMNGDLGAIRDANDPRTGLEVAPR